MEIIIISDNPCIIIQLYSNYNLMINHCITYAFWKTSKNLYNSQILYVLALNETLRISENSYLPKIGSSGHFQSLNTWHYWKKNIAWFRQNSYAFNNVALDGMRVWVHSVVSWWLKGQFFKKNSHRIGFSIAYKIWNMKNINPSFFIRNILFLNRFWKIPIRKKI